MLNGYIKRVQAGANFNSDRSDFFLGEICLKTPGWLIKSHYSSLAVCRFISRFEDDLFIRDYTLILFLPLN